MTRFIVRPIQSKDLNNIYRLSQTANFINLPAQKNSLKEKIECSIKSFNREYSSKSDAHYMFVLEDTYNSKVVGNCALNAQHGSVEEPHVFFEVKYKTKESKSLNLRFDHEILSFGFNTDGPTEIGGLVLDAEYRGQGLGKLLSFSRFMFMKANPERFKQDVLAELMPPFDKNGSTILWEELGRKFTSMSYKDADILSRKNKEFIPALFPEGNIYTCMLSLEARKMIGQVGKATLGVKKMLSEIGFSYKKMIDPFDGGPHYWAALKDISIVKETKVACKVLNKTEDMRKTKGYLMGLLDADVFASEVECFVSDQGIYVEDNKFKDFNELLFWENKK